MSDKHFVSKSDTVPSEKDWWQTPKSLFNALDKEFEFGVDVCAASHNSLCECFL